MGGGHGLVTSMRIMATQCVDMLEKAFELNPEDRFEYDFMKDWKKILNFLIKR